MLVEWELPVAVAEASFGIQPITNTLLQDLGFRKAPIVRAIPDDLALVSDLKHTAGVRNQGHFTQIRSEGREELLANQAERSSH